TAMPEPVDELTFEQALERLEGVVRELESNETGLDRSLARYEEGVQLLRRCRAILDAAERKVRILTGIDGAGNPVTELYDDTPTAERDVAAAREPVSRVQRNSGRGQPHDEASAARDGERLF